MAEVKYIRTKHDEIIVFSELLNHSDFERFHPISAGFISIESVNRVGYYETYCTCYGHSVTLDMKSRGEEDSKLARKQILGYDM